MPIRWVRCGCVVDSVPANVANLLLCERRRDGESAVRRLWRQSWEAD